MGTLDERALPSAYFTTPVPPEYTDAAQLAAAFGDPPTPMPPSVLPGNAPDPASQTTPQPAVPDDKPARLRQPPKPPTRTTKTELGGGNSLSTYDDGSLTPTLANGTTISRPGDSPDTWIIRQPGKPDIKIEITPTPPLKNTDLLLPPVAPPAAPPVK